MEKNNINQRFEMMTLSTSDLKEIEIAIVEADKELDRIQKGLAKYHAQKS